MSEQQAPRGSLVVVGTGIQLVSQMTIEAKAAIEEADKVLYLVADPATRYWIKKLNSGAESLHHFYEQGKPRIQTYLEMVEKALSYVREGLDVCVALYGHPGVFVFPSHEMVKRARAEGFQAKMLPGISAEDCLFADLGIDPSMHGCQSFEATDFLIHRRTFDTTSSLILWQIGVVGEANYTLTLDTKNLRILVEHLENFYDQSHQVAIYEASPYPTCDPTILWVALHDVPSSPVTPISTLYVPPKAKACVDEEMMNRLNYTSPTRASIQR